MDSARWVSQCSYLYDPWFAVDRPSGHGLPRTTLRLDPFKRPSWETSLWHSPFESLPHFIVEIWKHACLELKPAANRRRDVVVVNFLVQNGVCVATLQELNLFRSYRVYKRLQD